MPVPQVGPAIGVQALSANMLLYMHGCWLPGLHMDADNQQRERAELLLDISSMMAQQGSSMSCDHPLRYWHLAFAAMINICTAMANIVIPSAFGRQPVHVSGGHIAILEEHNLPSDLCALLEVQANKI